MSKRAMGFYFLRWDNTDLWTIGKWSGYDWCIVGDSWGHQTHEFAEAIPVDMPGKPE
jgi:hypothetical protein